MFKGEIVMEDGYPKISSLRITLKCFLLLTFLVILNSTMGFITTKSPGNTETGTVEQFPTRTTSWIKICWAHRWSWDLLLEVWLWYWYLNLWYKMFPQNHQTRRRGHLKFDALGRPNHWLKSPPKVALNNRFLIKSTSVHGNWLTSSQKSGSARAETVNLS